MDKQKAIGLYIAITSIRVMMIIMVNSKGAQPEQHEAIDKISTLKHNVYTYKIT